MVSIDKSSRRAFRTGAFVALLFGASLTPAACGGNVVVDDATGAGGEPAPSVSATSTGGAGGAGPGGCDALLREYTERFEVATSCNVCTDADACIGGPTITDPCGCPAGAHGFPVEDAQQAKAAYDAWVSAGCGPNACNTTCTQQGTRWFCGSASQTCEGGRCQPGG